MKNSGQIGSDGNFSHTSVRVRCDVSVVVIGFINGSFKNIRHNILKVKPFNLRSIRPPARSQLLEILASLLFLTSLFLATGEYEI